MKRFQNSSIHAALVTALAATAMTVSGCFSDSTEGTGELSVAVTDAPVEDATAVVVQFNGLRIHSAAGETRDFDFDEPRHIDLLALEGDASEQLLEDEEVTAGDYQWIEVKVQARQGQHDSWIEFEDGTEHSLYVPSGAESGLRLVSGFTVPVNGSADFTIDFDLRKSVHNPGASGLDYKLRPALRMVNNVEVGTLAGSVSSEWAADEECAGAVYVYDGHDADTGSLGSDDSPLTSASVSMNEDGDFTYEVGFLLAGEYTAAFTCEADEDDPEEASDIEFLQSANTEIEVDETTQLDFGPDS